MRVCLPQAARRQDHRHRIIGESIIDHRGQPPKPLSVEEYLTLVDWTGRQIVRGKCGAIPAHLPPLLARVGIPSANWLPLVTRFGRLFHRVAGAPHSLARLPRRGSGRVFRPGRARLLAGT
jgi:hypothetical protein